MNPFPAKKFLQLQSEKLGEFKGRFKAQSNYASAIGNPCARALVYARTSADQAIPIDDDGVARMEEGKTQEDNTKNWIEVLGYKIERTQERFEIPEALIHGKIDGVVTVFENGHEVGKWPAEIKSIQPEDWQRLNTMQDIASSDKSWHQKWYAQVQLAIHYLKNQRMFGPFGVLFLKDKTRKIIKPIPFDYDEKLIEHLIKKGIEINEHVKNNTLPDRISYSSGHCKWCDYRLICNPEEIFKAGKNIQDQEFLAKLREYHDIKETASKANKLWDYIKDILKGVSYAVCGEFQIEGKERKGGGWILTITKIFSPSVEELSPNPCPGERIYNTLVKQIEAATTMEQLMVCKEPAKAAQKNKSITPSQAKSLAEIFDSMALKLWQKGK